MGPTAGPWQIVGALEGAPSHRKESEMCFHFSPIKIIFKVRFGFQTVLRAERLRGWGRGMLGMVVTLKCAKNYLKVGDFQEFYVRYRFHFRSVAEF